MTGVNWTEERLAAAQELLASHSPIAASKKLGVTTSALKGAFKRAGLQTPGSYQIADGQRLRGHSTLVDANGGIDRKWIKTERDSDDPPDVPKVPEGFTIRKVSTLVDGQNQVRAQWTQADQKAQDRWDTFWASCERASIAYKGLADPVSAPDAVVKNFMTVYPLGDPHIGMMSWGRETGQNFDLKIAERDLIRVVDMLVDRAPASERGVLVNVGDFLHAQSDTQLTPHGGNKLDVDGRWSKITEVGFSIMRRLTERLLTKHTHVDVYNLPGNHDPAMATMIAWWCKAVFEREPRVTVHDANNPYQYLRHGKNLIGLAHGDGAKMEALPGIMAVDKPQDWGATLYRCWLTGHVHHQQCKEYPGCTVESFRTLATRDAWHNGKGYRSGQSLSCITFDDEYGEVTRSTVDLRLGRSHA